MTPARRSTAARVWGKMRIPHGHGDTFMAQKLLNGTQVNPSHHKTTSKGVAEAMPRKSPNLGSANQRLKPVSWASQGFALWVANHRPGAITSVSKLG
jgi:hypothetical protein